MPALFYRGPELRLVLGRVPYEMCQIAISTNRSKSGRWGKRRREVLTVPTDMKYG